MTSNFSHNLRIQNFPLKQFLHQDIADFLLLLEYAKNIATQEIYRAEELLSKAHNNEQKRHALVKTKQYREYSKKCDRITAYLATHIMKSELTTNSGEHSFVEFLENIISGLYGEVLLSPEKQNDVKNLIVEILLKSPGQKISHDDLLEFLARKLSLKLSDTKQRNKIASAITYAKNKAGFLIEASPMEYALDREHKTVKLFQKKSV